MNRVERRQLAREEKVDKPPGGKADEKRQICPFPDCGRTFQPVPDRWPFCNHHIQFVKDLNFCVNRVSIHNNPPPGKEPPADGRGASLILPDGYTRRKEGVGP